MILDALGAAAAARASKHWPSAPVILVLWSYLRRLSARFDRLLARVQSGRFTASHPRPSRPATPRKYKQLPQGFAWLLRVVPGSVLYGSQLQHLLDDPEMARLLAAAPHMARMLRPLRRMLGHPPDPPLAAAATVPRKSAHPGPTNDRPSHGAWLIVPASGRLATT